MGTGSSFTCPVQVASVPPFPARSCPAPPGPMERPKDVTKGRKDPECKPCVLLGLPPGWERSWMDVQWQECCLGMAVFSRFCSRTDRQRRSEAPVLSLLAPVPALDPTGLYPGSQHPQGRVPGLRSPG